MLGTAGVRCRECILGLDPGQSTTDHPPNKKNGGGADVLPLFY
jgi:hypothetical protein